MKAVCLRCGSMKPTHESVCSGCGHRPEGEGLLVAWLLSDAHLDEAELARAGERLRAGEVVRPSDAMLEQARKALGRHATRDHGMEARERAILLSTSILLTPLVGLTLWLWWREDRPKSAIQAFWLSAPVSVIFFALVVGRYLTFFQAS